MSEHDKWTADLDRESIYERAGMVENYVGFGDSPALVVVDEQYAFTDPEHPGGADLPAVVERTNELLDAAHEADVPVVFTRVITTHPDGADLGMFGQKVEILNTLTPDSRWVELDDRLHVAEGDYLLDKRQQSAFHETELDSMLQADGIDTVIVTGISTSGCVRATVVDACSHGYRTVVAEDAVGDRSTAQHEANLYDMAAKVADVLPTEAVLEYLADHAPASAEH